MKDTMTEEELQEIENRMTGISPGPWYECSRDACQCVSVWCDDHPVAEVIKGNWGDDFPSIKLEGNSPNIVAVPFMDQFTYGEVSIEEAMANREFIAHTRTDIPKLIAEIRRLKQELKK